MKNIFKIFFRDLKKIFKNPIATITILGVCFIPALYAWFNIIANWDPYGSTDGIKVAVSNIDKGYTLSNSDVNIGDKVVENLKANKQIGWEFVDKDENIEGVKSGKYYAGIVIPENFTKDLSSVLDSKLEYPKFEYYINQKKNAIAPKITDKGVDVIQQELNNTFSKTIYEVVDNILKTLYDNLNDAEKDIFGRVKSSFDRINKSLDEYKGTIDIFLNTSDSVKAVINSTKFTLPALAGISQNGNDLTNDTNALIHSTVDFSDNINNLVTNSLDNMDFLVDDILSSLDNINTDIEGINDISILEIDKIDTKLNKIHDDNESLIKTLRRINNRLPIKITKIEKTAVMLEDLNKSLVNIMGTGVNIKDILASGENLGNDLKRNLQSQVKTINNDLLKIKNDYNDNVKPQVDAMAEKTYRILNDMYLLTLNTKNGVASIDKVLDENLKAIDSGAKALNSTKSLLTSSQESITELKNGVSRLEKEIKSDRIEKILSNDPKLLATFLSSPVAIESKSFYEIKNYGSAMAPFYSVLSLWVGGVVLVSLLKVRVYEDEYVNNFRPYQSYFGRYLLFMCIGIMQALIVCLGDLYILKIQCLNPELFILSGVVTSFVFTNIIYTLTVSFGDVGKALCVFLLVIQIAGSGGTFPIEVTPSFFQMVYPLLPFTYAINAMRETIAGIYGNHFNQDIIHLLYFVPFSLLLGVVLRVPLIKVNEFFEEKLEETHLI